MSGLFGTFNTARSGMSVQQRNIDVTNHNISNANTEGYSRQRTQVVTNNPYTIEGGAGQVGTGAQIQAIERVRDNFVDYQIRGETGVLGKYEVRNRYLHEVESIFNEPSDTGISNMMGKFYDSWQELSKQPSSSNARTVVAQQSAALADTLNHTYTKLDELQTNSQEMLKSSVTEVNSLLTQIDGLNKEIVSVTVGGNTPNDLMDRRDLLLDKLSYKMNFTVEKKQFNGIDLKPDDYEGVTSPNLVSTAPNGQIARFSYISSLEQDKSDPSGETYNLTYYKKGNMKNESDRGTIKVVGLTPEVAKEIEENGIIWADSTGQAIKGDGYPIKDGDRVLASEIMQFKPQKGDISGLVTVQRDIQDYKEQLNKLAKSIAFTVNTIHSGISDPLNNGKPARDYLPFFVNKDIAKYNINGSIDNLDDTLVGETEITAQNININKEIIADVMKIKTRANDNQFAETSDNNLDGEGDGSRALAIAQLRDSMVRVQDINESVESRKDMFDLGKGTSILQNNGMKIGNTTSGMKIEGYFKDTIDRLGVQAQEADRMVKNQDDLIYSLNETRASVSGVSLDEEMANLIQFEHSFSASAKIISTLDQLLDVVVNGLKR